MCYTCGTHRTFCTTHNVNTLPVWYTPMTHARLIAPSRTYYILPWYIKHFFLCLNLLYLMLSDATPLFVYLVVHVLLPTYYSTTLLTTCAHTVVLQNQLGCSETSIVFCACVFDQDCSLSSYTHTRRLY